ncbi:C-type lectin domain family 2 member D-like isoform X1 [Apteryx mantelli]|uniref:C-type lectin domain family 2 member D-like isoform X1 n=1 Tax=Apteryx mantelli TaxID=2696672 RepID=A0ABM4FYA2_9AVES
MSGPASELLYHMLLVPESVIPVRQEKNNRSCFTEGVQEQPLDEAGSPGRVGCGSAVSAGMKKRVLMGESKVWGAERGRCPSVSVPAGLLPALGQRHLRCERLFVPPGDLRRPRQWHLRALAVSAAINVVLLVCIAVGAAIWCSRPQTTGAAALGCRDGWIGYRGICYYVSLEEASWESSQHNCSSLGASLAVLKREWEVPFLRELKGSADCWLGLRRQDGRLVWVNNTVYNETFPVHGQGACAYMSDAAIASSSCSQLRPYICSVALAPISLL